MTYHIYIYSILTLIILALTVTLIVLVVTDKDDNNIECPECVTDALRTISIIAEPTNMKLNLYNNEGRASFTNFVGKNIKLDFEVHNNNPTIEDKSGMSLYLDVGAENKFVFADKNNASKNLIIARAELVGNNAIHIYAIDSEDKKYYLTSDEVMIKNIRCPFILPSIATGQPTLLSIV